MMIIQKFVQITVVASMLFFTGGTALAETVTIENTGPDSEVKVEIKNKTELEVNTVNDIQVLNLNEQIAKTGNVDESENTNGGSAVSGDATNNNATTTAISINNTAGGMGGDNGGSDGDNNGGSGGDNNGGSGGGSGSNGDVQGASTGGMGSGSGEVETLPEVGASQFVDVSALRALYRPATLQSPAMQFPQSPQGISLMFLLIAAVVSVIGAYGSAAFAERRSQRRGI